MMRFCFFTLLIIAFIGALFFRLNHLLAQTDPLLQTDEPKNQSLKEQPPFSTMSPLAAKVAAQRALAENNTPIVFEIPAHEQRALEQIDAAQTAPYLAQLFARMRPRAAARLMAEMDTDQSVAILARMPLQTAVDILAALPTDTALALSTDLADYISNK